MPDTTIKIDSTGFIEITASWKAVAGFGDGSSVDYDTTGGWISFVDDYKMTTAVKSIEVGNGTYSFRVWSKYAHPSGNVIRSSAPSPEYLVEFQLTEKAPARVTLPMRFEAKQ